MLSSEATLISFHLIFCLIVNQPKSQHFIRYGTGPWATCSTRVLSVSIHVVIHAQKIHVVIPHAQTQAGLLVSSHVSTSFASLCLCFLHGAYLSPSLSTQVHQLEFVPTWYADICCACMCLCAHCLHNCTIANVYGRKTWAGNSCPSAPCLK